MNNDVLLKRSLEVAVPLWIEAFKNYDWNELKRVMTDSENILSTSAEGILYRIEGKSAKAFNALAKAIAALSFVPNGIEIFGMKFQSEEKKNETKS